MPGMSPKASRVRVDRKSTRLNSSHVKISDAVLCLKKKKIALRHDEYGTTRKRAAQSLASAPATGRRSCTRQASSVVARGLAAANLRADFFILWHGHPRDLHYFPTRRSSD